MAKITNIIYNICYIILYLFAAGLNAAFLFTMILGILWGTIPKFSIIPIIFLGIGFGCYLLAINACVKSKKAATPLFIIAALTQYISLFIVLTPYFYQAILPPVICTSGLLMMQYGLTYLALKRPILHFYTFVFGLSFLFAILSLF